MTKRRRVARHRRGVVGRVRHPAGQPPRARELSRRRHEPRSLPRPPPPRTGSPPGQQPDGRYLYEYDRATDEARPGYNIVRHAGVTMSLYQLAAVGR